MSCVIKMTFTIGCLHYKEDWYTRILFTYNLQREGASKLNTSKWMKQVYPWEVHKINVLILNVNLQCFPLYDWRLILIKGWKFTQQKLIFQQFSGNSLRCEATTANKMDGTYFPEASCFTHSFLWPICIGYLVFTGPWSQRENVRPGPTPLGIDTDISENSSFH